MVHSGMTGGGTPGLEHKFGKYLSYEEAVHQNRGIQCVDI